MKMPTTILYIILIDLKLIEHKNFKMEVQLNLKAILIISIIFLSFFVNFEIQNTLFQHQKQLIFFFDRARFSLLFLDLQVNIQKFDI